MRRDVFRVGARAKPGPQHYMLAGLCAWLALGCGDSPSEAPRASEPLAAQQTARAPEAEWPVVLFIGTSLTAGSGLTEEQAFPALVQQRIDRADLGYRVVNAGVSGDTSAGGLRRIEWLLRLPIAILVLELGANDMLRGLQIDAMRDNLSAILDLTHAAYPDARFVIAGMRAAPNLGRGYAREFDAVFPELAARHDASLIPFLLEGVAAVRSLNQADGIHPSAAGHEVLADTVWEVLEPVLRAGERS